MSYTNTADIRKQNRNKFRDILKKHGYTKMKARPAHFQKHVNDDITHIVFADVIGMRYRSVVLLQFGTMSEKAETWFDEYYRAVYPKTYLPETNKFEHKLSNDYLHFTEISGIQYELYKDPEIKVLWDKVRNTCPFIDHPQFFFFLHAYEQPFDCRRIDDTVDLAVMCLDKTLEKYAQKWTDPEYLLKLYSTHTPSPEEKIYPETRFIVSWFQWIKRGLVLMHLFFPERREEVKKTYLKQLKMYRRKYPSSIREMKSNLSEISDYIFPGDMDFRKVFDVPDKC